MENWGGTPRWRSITTMIDINTTIKIWPNIYSREVSVFADMTLEEKIWCSGKTGAEDISRAEKLPKKWGSTLSISKRKCLPPSLKSFSSAWTFRQLSVVKPPHYISWRNTNSRYLISFEFGNSHSPCQKMLARPEMLLLQAFLRWKELLIVFFSL